MSEGMGVCMCGDVYPVRAGESYRSIARDLGITVLELAECNPYVDPGQLVAGQVLCVPGRWRTFCAQYGQDYGQILSRHDVSDALFRAANPHISPGRILPGQRYRVLCRSG